MNDTDGMNFSDMPLNNEDDLYPEFYYEIESIIEQIINEMERKYGEIMLTEDMLRQITEEAIRLYGLEEAVPTSFDAEPEAAVPVINEFGRGNRGRNNRRPRRRNFRRDEFSDVFRILFLQQVIGSRRRRWHCCR